MRKFFSVAIPAYEMCGWGVEFLEYSFTKLEAQTFKDFEVVVSDHSSGDEIENLCQAWQDVFAVKYIRNKYLKGSSSANLNNALSHSSGEWIKILFQDDFLYDINSLELIKRHIDSYHPKWVACACEHTIDGKNMHRPFYPRWNDDIEFGNNTISSPSVISLKNENVIFFNETLSWLMDVEYYKRMFDLHGEPSYLNDIVVVNRMWQGSLTNQIGDELKNKELEIVKNRPVTG